MTVFSECLLFCVLLIIAIFLIIILIIKRLDTKPLHKAALYGEKEKVIRLILRGKQVNEEDSDGLSPLHCAVIGDHKNTVETLLSHGANINSQNEKCSPPLFLANTENMANLLISHGANINTINQDGLNLLHNAALFGKEEIVKLCLENNFDTNYSDKLGRTALHYGAEKGARGLYSESSKKEIIKMLIEAGVEKELKDKNGQTALDIAKKCQHETIVSYLESLK